MKFYNLCLFAPILIFVAGCKADPVADPNDQDVLTRAYRAMTYEKAFYFDEAVEKARKYALENLSDISEESIHEVKFTTPRFYQRRIFARGYGRDSSKRDIAETLIVWKVPEDPDNNSIVIFGVGQRRLDDWYPVRGIIKPFDTNETDITSKTKKDTEPKNKKKKKKKKKIEE